MKSWRHSLLVALFTSLVNSSVGHFRSFFLFLPPPFTRTLQAPFLMYTFPAYRSPILSIHLSPKAIPTLKYIAGQSIAYTVRGGVVANGKDAGGASLGDGLGLMNATMIVRVCLYNLNTLWHTVVSDLVYTGCAQTHSSFKQSVVYRLSFHAHPPQDNAHRVDGVDSSELNFACAASYLICLLLQRFKSSVTPFARIL